MKYFLHTDGNGENTAYTQELLKHLAVKNGHKMVAESECDAVLFSMTSHYEIDKLIKLRKLTKKPIIVGGHASNSPLPLLEFCDYVNLGSGFEFFEKVISMETIESFDFIVSKNKRKGKYSNYINWNNIPLVQISKNSFSYLESVGCQHKCKFCVTSWMNKYQKNPNEKAIKAVLNKYGAKQLYLIGNNYNRNFGNLNVSDATIKEYNECPQKYEKIKLIRVGLESPSEETRKWLAKPISDSDIKEFFYKTKIMKKRSNIFMIAGIDDQEKWEEFRDIMGKDFENSKPSASYIINYFDPSMGTPFERYNLANIKPINIPRIKRLWKLHNARTIIFRDLTISWKNSTLDSLIQRSSEKEKILKLLKIKKNVYKDAAHFFNDLVSEGFEKEIAGEYKYDMDLERSYKHKDNRKEVGALC